jgi:subtilisin family serine protease
VTHSNRRFAIFLALAILGTALYGSESFAAPRRTVELSHWALSNGGVTTATAGYPLVAAADRLLVGLSAGGSFPGHGVTQQARTESLRLAAASGGRVARLLAGGQVAVVDLPAGSNLYSAAADILFAGAKFVEPDLAVYPARIPNDPRYSDQFHHPIINSPSAWDVTTGSASVVIAVIDSGVDTDHPDLDGRIWVNPAETPYNGKDDDGNGYVDDWRGWDFYNNNNDPNPEPDGIDNNHDGTPDEQVSHGTLVAGLAAAIGNNSFGTVGVAWTATIMPLQIFPDDGTTYVSTVIEAIDYAVNMGADIINLSIGAPYEESFSPAINRAYEAGICVISAGGNNGKELTDSKSTWTSPVCNDGPNVFVDNYVLGVGGLDRNSVLAWYSNFDTSSANFIDVCAPGTALFGPTYYDPSIPGFGSYFGTNTGTSFSAPLVTGLAALVLAKNPGFSPAQVYAEIRNNCDNIDSLNPGYVGALGMGRINCGRTLGEASAPAAVTNFQAFDTPDDNGGSASLTWTKSADDGGGANSLTAYQVLRRHGTTGAFAQIAELPPGTQSYTDTDVVDGDTYYYKIRSTDGNLTSETQVSGAVVPANDSVPEPIDDLSALDRPNDEGGAITLEWSGYNPPPDFASYRIYRSNRDFSSTTGATLVQTISTALTTNWMDSTTQDGVDYYYAVGVRDSAGNEETNIRATGPVQSYANTNITMGPGLFFIGPAAVPPDRDPATMLNVPPEQLRAARWDPAAESYEIYLPGAIPETLQLQLGRGFWANLDQATVVQATGASAPAGNFSIDLTPGWHQLANPFFAPLDFSKTTVTVASNTMDLASAQNANIIRALAWTYATEDNEYRLAYPTVPSQPASLIAPWAGFWALILQPCTLTLARPSGTATASDIGTPAATKTASADWPGRWQAQVVLRASGASVDTQNYIGIADKDYLIPSPPAIGNNPQLHLSRANCPHDETAPLAVSLANSATARWTWDLDVTNLAPGTAAEIAMPDLSSLPADYIITLHDPLTGASTFLRTASEYRFVSRSAGSRAFQLTVREKTASSLAINTMSVQPNRSGGAQIAFSLSADAQTDVEILNIAGRSVRKVEQEHLRLAGNHTILFNGRNGYGARVPDGCYLVALRAKAQDGCQVRQLMTVNLTR